MQLYSVHDAANAAQNMRLLAATKHFKIEASYQSQQKLSLAGEGCSYNDARPFVCVQRDSVQTTFHLYRIIHPGRTCELLSLHSLHSAQHIHKVEAYLLRIKQNGNISDTKLLAMAAHGITHGEYKLCIYIQQLQIEGPVNPGLVQ